MDFMEESDLRFTLRRLRAAFRGAADAHDSGYVIDSSGFFEALAEVAEPSNRYEAREYVKTCLTAARLRIARKEFGLARELLADVLTLSVEFSLEHHKLKAIAMLASILKKHRENLPEALALIQFSIETSSSLGRREYLRRARKDEETLKALIRHFDSLTTPDGVLFHDEGEYWRLRAPEHFTFTRLPFVEAYGARRGSLRLYTQRIRRRISWR